MTTSTDVDPLASARRIHADAVELNNGGRPNRALRGHLRALKELDAVRSTSTSATSAVQALRGRVWLSIALSKAEIGGWAAGSDALATAERIATTSHDRELRALVSAQRGLLLVRAGRLADAMEEMNVALCDADFVSAKDQCNMRVTRGALAMYLGAFARARDDLVTAERLASVAGLSLERHKALHNLGYLEFLRGDLPSALTLMSDAMRLTVELTGGIPLLDRARVLLEAGLSRDADETLAEAGRIFARERLSQDVGEVEIERARCALVAGDLAIARRLAGTARDRFRRRGNDQARRTAELVLLQADLAAGRPGLRLADPALRLSAEFSAEGLTQLATNARLIAAEAYLAAHQDAWALDALAGMRQRRDDPISARLHHRYVSARLEAARGRSAAASSHIRAGLRDLAVYQASFGSIDLQTASAVHGRQLAELDVALALRPVVAGRPVGALHTGRAARVFAAAERSRAVSSRLPAVRPPEDAETAELLTELRQTVESLRAVEQDRAAAQPLVRRRRELEQQITARRWSLAGEGTVAPPATADDVQDTLHDTGTTLLQYVQSDGRLHAVVLDGHGMRVHELGPATPVVELIRRARADLDVLAYPHLPTAMQQAVLAAARRSLAQLDAALSAAEIARSGRLVVITTGLLGHVAWGALPSLRGVPVVVAPSATAWLAATRAPARKAGDVIALAGPDLARSAQEARGVARRWPGASARSGRNADRETLCTALATARIVHIAAHGVHQTENPLFSSLRLADGELFAHELDPSAEIAEHVVLSACEAGLSTVRPGDEALGLTSVFLHFGTRSVVAGVSRVADDLAADTMVEYHRLLARGADSAAALATVSAGSELPVPFVCFGSTVTVSSSS